MGGMLTEIELEFPPSDGVRTVLHGRRDRGAPIWHVSIHKEGMLRAERAPARTIQQGLVEAGLAAWLLTRSFLAGADFLPAAGAAVGLQDLFSEADGFGGDFHEFVVGYEFDGLLEA